MKVSDYELSDMVFTGEEYGVCFVCCKWTLCQPTSDSEDPANVHDWIQFAKWALLGDRLTTFHVPDVICIHLTLHCTNDDGFGLLELFFSDVLATLMPSMASALSSSLETWRWSLTDDSSWRIFQTLQLRACLLTER